MANSLEFDIYDLDVTGLSSISELTNVLVSIRNRSLITIKDFDSWLRMLPNLKNELTLSGLSKIIHGLLSSCGDEQIIVLTTNHDHIDRVDAALPRPLNTDLYIHKSSPQPIALPDGGEIVLLDSSEQKPSVNFDATYNVAYHSDVFVSNSEENYRREASRRQCMPEGVLSLVDSTIKISSKDFDAPNNNAHLVRAYQSGRIVFISEKKDMGEGLNRECLTKSVLSLDDSSKQKSLSDVVVTENKSHLVRAYQSGPVLSFSDNKNGREALERECITKIILGLEDLRQHSRGRRDAAAKSFCNSLAWKSFEVLDSLPLGEQSYSSRHLARRRTLTHKHCVRLKKSQDLPRSLQRDRSGGLAAQSDISLLDGGHILSLSEKKIVRKSLKRKCRTMSVLSLEDHQQHVGTRWEDDVNFLGANHIFRQFAIHYELAAKCIRRQHGTRQWLFKQSTIDLPDAGHILYLSKNKIVRKTLKRKCKTLSALSLDYHQHVDSRWEDAVKRLGSKRICRQHGIHRWPFQQSAIRLPDGGQILSLSEKKIVRKTLKRKCRSTSVLSLEDHKQHVDRRWEDAAKSHGAKRICRQLVIHRLSTAKRIRKQHRIHWWPFQRSFISLPDGGHILPLSEKKIVRKTLKRKCGGMSVLSLVDRQQHVDRRWEDAAKNIGAKRICRRLVIHRVSIAKHMCRQHGIYHQWPFQQDLATMKGYSLGDERPVEVISLSTHAKLVSRHQLIYISWLSRFSPRPSALAGGGEVGGPIALSLSESAATKNIAQRVGQDKSGSAASDTENERTREQEDLKEIYTSIASDDLRRLYGRMNRKDAAASLGVSIATFKRKCREFRIKRWPHVRKKKVGRPPDQHGERNTSTACKMPLHNVHARMEGEPVGQNQEANEFERDLIEHSIALNTENDSTIAVYSETEAARGSSKWAFQLEGQTMQYTTYPYHNDLVFSQPQIASIEVPNENMGSLQDRRDLLASQVVAPQQEPLSEGNVFAFGNWTVGSCSDLAPTEPMHPFSHATGSSENLENLLASVDEHFMGGNVCGSSMSAPALSQPISTSHHTMAPHTLPLPTDGSVKIEATYQGDNIKFQFPLTSGIKELKEEMSKTPECKLGSFKVKYKDEGGEWILMGLDEHVREYLQLLLGNKATTKLKVQNKVHNTMNFCDNCKCYNFRSLKRKRP